MPQQLFITGTDTDVGKTLISAAILYRCKQLGLSTVGFKPIASGCQQTTNGLRNSDALALQSNSSIPIEYNLVNPISFEDPIAPHIAADRLGKKIDLDVIDNAYSSLLSKNPDLLLTEGAGGWHLPITATEYFSSWVSNKQQDVVLVVGIKLGCLNHALLTEKAIQDSDAKFVGWVANSLSENIANYDEMVETLTVAFGMPPLAEVPFYQNSDKQIENAAACFNLASILEK